MVDIQPKHFRQDFQNDRKFNARVLSCMAEFYDKCKERDGLYEHTLYFTNSDEDIRFLMHFRSWLWQNDWKRVEGYTGGDLYMIIRCDSPLIV